MPKKKKISTLEAQTTDLISLKQAIEWVAFGLPPLAEDCEELRPKDSIWLYNRDPDSPVAEAISSAHMELFKALRTGTLIATAYAAEEIKIANYDKDNPYFQPALQAPANTRSTFKPQKIDKAQWDYDSIFWSDSSLIYDRKDLSANRWLLAQGICIEASKLYEHFPRGVETSVTHTGDPGRPSSAHLYVQELERRIKEKRIEATLAGQARALHNWLTSKYPELSPPTVGTIENRIRPLYRKSQKPTK